MVALVEIDNVIDFQEKVNVRGIPTYQITPDNLKKMFCMKALDRNSYLYLALVLDRGDCFAPDQDFDVEDFCDRWNIQEMPNPVDTAKLVTLQLEIADVLLFVGRLAKKGILDVGRITQLTLDLWGSAAQV